MRYNVAKTGATAVGSQISLVNCEEGVKAGNWVELHKNAKGYMLVKEKKRSLTSAAINDAKVPEILKKMALN